MALAVHKCHQGTECEVLQIGGCQMHGGEQMQAGVCRAFISQGHRQVYVEQVNPVGQAWAAATVMALSSGCGSQSKTHMVFLHNSREMGAGRRGGRAGLWRVLWASPASHGASTSVAMSPLCGPGLPPRGCGPWKERLESTVLGSVSY